MVLSNKNFVIILYSNFAAAYLYSMSILTFPFICKERVQMEESIVGFIFSLYSISYLFFVPLLSQISDNLGKKKSLLLMTLLGILACLLSISLNYIENLFVFKIVGSIMRISSGISIGCLQSLGFSVTSDISTEENQSSNISLAEIATSLGMMTGPFMSGVILIYIGYDYCYILIILMMIISFFLIQMFLEIGVFVLNIENENKFLTIDDNSVINVINDENNITKKNENYIYFDKEKNQDNEKEFIIPKNSTGNLKSMTTNSMNIMNLPKRANTKTSFHLRKKNSFVSIRSIESFDKSNLFTVITHPRILLVFFIITIDMISQCFFYPVFNQYMKTRFNQTEYHTSLLLSYGFLIYVIGLRVVLVFIHYFNVKYVLSLGVLCNSISLSLLSDIQIYPNSVLLVVAGITLLNFTSGFSVVTGIIEYEEVLRKNFKLPKSTYHNLSSELYIIAMMLGESFGAMIGGYMFQYYSFNNACFLVGILNVTACLFYILISFSNILNQMQETFYKNFLIKSDFSITKQLSESFLNKEIEEDEYEDLSHQKVSQANN